MKFLIFVSTRDVSSVGSERLLDRQEVDSSILSRPTNLVPRLIADTVSRAGISVHYTNSNHLLFWLIVFETTNISCIIFIGRRPDHKLTIEINPTIQRIYFTRFGIRPPSCKCTNIYENPTTIPITSRNS